ncbi:ROK family protein [Bacillus songklensis]|uniref:ROK family protein n=1 Tax=Bacillus songklensis TaxID=1069116 RepID=A0ABV8B1G7_9BACI
MKKNMKSTSRSIKERNKTLILQTIMEKGPISRSTISVQLKLSKATVSSLVDELISEGLVLENGFGKARQQGGRKPIHLTFNARAAYIIGIDIGGTKTLLALSDLTGTIIDTVLFSTQEYVQQKFLFKLSQMIHDLLHKHELTPKCLLGMGIGVPGMTDAEKGMVIDAPTLKWKDYSLRHDVEQLFQVPVFIDNDVNLAVLGEQWKGAAAGKKNVVLIAIGTGVGCGIVINNQLYHGSSWAAGEIGYMVTDKGDALADHGRVFDGYGYLDSRIGGAGISCAYKKRTRLVKSAKEIFLRAQQGEAAALSVVREVVEHIGFAVSNVISLINPETVLLGGGISNSTDWFLKDIERILKEWTPIKAEIKTTDLGAHAVVIGAVSFVLTNNESALLNFRKDEGGYNE